MAKPKVFVNSINKSIKNNKEVYHFRGDDIRDIEMIDESVDVNYKINEIFNSDSFVYKSLVEITLKDGSRFKDDVIAMKDSYLITLNNRRININDIINIKKA